MQIFSNVLFWRWRVQINKARCDFIDSHGEFQFPISQGSLYTLNLSSISCLSCVSVFMGPRQKGKKNLNKTEHKHPYGDKLVLLKIKISWRPHPTACTFSPCFWTHVLWSHCPLNLSLSASPPCSRLRWSSSGSSAISPATFVSWWVRWLGVANCLFEPSHDCRCQSSFS